MKIFLVIPTLRQGGAERVMSELANNFVSNHEVHLILLAKAQDFYTLNNKVIIHRMGFENESAISSVLLQLRVLLGMRSLIIKEKPRFILSFGAKYNILTLIASMNLTPKVFISDRSSPDKRNPFIITLLRRFLYRNADGIIAQTITAKEKLKLVTNHNNIRVIPNPIRNVVTSKTTVREKIVLNVGRLVPEKGQKYLIDAFYEIAPDDWSLVILGEGNCREALEDRIESLGLKGRVKLPGTVTEIDEWLQRSSIFVFPSISEGFPNSLVEAMIAGLPCISFDCVAGPRDIITDNVNGFLIQPKDVKALKVKMFDLINNQTLRSSIACNNLNLQSKYNSQNISKNYIKFMLENDKT